MGGFIQADFQCSSRKEDHTFCQMAFLKEGEKRAVLLVDDHEGFRQELRLILKRHEDVEVIGDV